MNRPILNGVIEHFGRNLVRGWCSVENEGILVPLSVTISFEEWSATVEAPLIARGNGQLVGFEFVIPELLKQLSAYDFHRSFKHVIVAWDWYGVRRQAPLLFFKSGVSTAVSDAARPLPRPKKPAILIRTHKADLKSIELAKQIEAITDTDVYFTVDTTRGPVSTQNYRQLQHSVDRFASLGLFADLPNLMWVCGDYPFYSAALDCPEYDFFLMIEYDVALAADGATWLMSLLARLSSMDEPQVDFFAPHFAEQAPERGWYANAKIVGRFDSVWKSVFPVVGLSRSAIFHLFSRRLAEASAQQASVQVDPNGYGVTYCEVFVPSALKEGGRFLCHSNRTLNICEKSPYFSTHLPLSSDAHRPENLEGAIAHPVLSLNDYLAKVTQFERTENRPAEWNRFSDLIRALPEDLKCRPEIEKVTKNAMFVGNLQLDPPHKQ